MNTHAVNRRTNDETERSVTDTADGTTDFGSLGTICRKHKLHVYSDQQLLSARNFL